MLCVHIKPLNIQTEINFINHFYFYFYSLRRRQRALPAAEDQAAPLPDPDQPGGLHQRPAVRRARPLRRATAVSAAAAEHHVADDRADTVR